MATLPGIAQPAPSGAYGFDADTVISLDVAQQFSGQGYQFCLRYLSLGSPQATGDLSPAEALDILNGGLALMPWPDLRKRRCLQRHCDWLSARRQRLVRSRRRGRRHARPSCHRLLQRLVRRSCECRICSGFICRRQSNLERPSALQFEVPALLAIGEQSPRLAASWISDGAIRHGWPGKRHLHRPGCDTNR